MSDETGRTTVPLSTETRDRLDDLVPGGPSWDSRVSALLDDYEAMLAEWDEDPLEGDVPDNVASVEDLDGLREDLLGQLPGRTARELDDRLGRR